MPLSRCTSRVLEVISEPCVELEPTEKRFNPRKPITPLAVDVNWPVAMIAPSVEADLLSDGEATRKSQRRKGSGGAVRAPDDSL